MSSNTNIGNTPVNQGYVQLIHTGETGGIDGTLRTLYDGDGTASDLQIASNKVKVSTELYIGSKTATEFIQDIVGDMFTTGSYTNITTTYDDTNGNIDLNATGAVSGITGGTGIDATGSGNITIAIDSTVATLTGTQTLTNKTLTAPTLTGTTQGASITLSGDLTVNGTTTTVNQTNLDVSDNIIGLNRGASSNANDSGLIIERGSTGDNAAIIWDESADKFTLGTTTSTPSATGNLTISTGTLVANVEGNITSSSASITGGSITGITDLAIADGGTGASNAGNARINLGLGTLAELNSIQVANFLASAITTSSEAFADNDTTVMTSAAINDRIESFGYGVGDMTGVSITASNPLDISQSNTTSGDYSATISLDATEFQGYLTDMTDLIAGFDELLVIDSSDTTLKRKAINEIRLTAFDDTGFSSGISFNGSTANGLLTYGNSTTADVETDLVYTATGLGIGTTSPSYLLHLSGTAPELAFTDTDGTKTWRARAVTNNFHITETGGGDLFVIESGAGGNALRVRTTGVSIPATKKLYLDGGSNTYIQESSADTLKIFVGGSTSLELGEGVTDYVRVLDNTYLGAGSSLDMYMRHDGTNSFLENGTGNLTIRNQALDQDIRFSVNDGGSTSNILTLNAASSRVGIGTTAPAHEMVLRKDQAAATELSIVNLTSNASASTNLRFRNATSGSESGNGGLIQLANGNAFKIINQFGNPLIFGTSNAEKMRIDSSGNVGIGTVSPDCKLHLGNNVATSAGFDSFADYQILLFDTGVATTSYGIGIRSNHMMFNSDRDYEWRSDNSAKMVLQSDGDLHLTADVIAFSTTPSDKRLKKNIKDIDYGLDTIMKLNPKEYDWKKDNRHDIGFIAQEVEEVIPEIVKNKEWFDDKIKTLDYEKLTAVLIKAVQEQQEQINELKEQLNG